MEEVTATNTANTSNPKIKIVQSQDKLNQINQQLADIRKKLSDRHVASHPRVKNKKKISTHNVPKKSLQKSLHHPKLNFVLGEVVFSPYMTKPLDPYPHETFEVPKKLHELKKKLQNDGAVPKEELPYDVEFVKDRFLHEVANFSVSFNITAEEKSPLVTARSRSGLRSPFSRQNSLEGGSSFVDDHSFFAKSSIKSAYAASLPPVQSNRRVPSSSGMRVNSLKSSSHDNVKTKSQSPSTTSSIASTKQTQLKPASKEGLVQNRNAPKLDMTKSLDCKSTLPAAAVKRSERLDTRQPSKPPVPIDSTSDASQTCPKEPSAIEEDPSMFYADDFAKFDIEEQTSVCAEKTESNSKVKSEVVVSPAESLTTPKPFCTLSHSDLELLMTSFAMVSYHMGR